MPYSASPDSNNSDGHFVHFSASPEAGEIVMSRIFWSAEAHFDIFKMAIRSGKLTQRMRRRLCE